MVTLVSHHHLYPLSLLNPPNSFICMFNLHLFTVVKLCAFEGTFSYMRYNKQYSAVLIN